MGEGPCSLSDLSSRDRHSYNSVRYFHTIYPRVGAETGAGRRIERGNAECRARAKPSLIYVFLVFMFEDMEDDTQHSFSTNILVVEIYESSVIISKKPLDDIDDNLNLFHVKIISSLDL